eukprot:1182226-Prorocentrum_minimum.AAC.1
MIKHDRTRFKSLLFICLFTGVQGERDHSRVPREPNAGGAGGEHYTFTSRQQQTAGGVRGRYTSGQRQYRRRRRRPRACAAA